MNIVEIVKAIILGIVEGITEWLPISSTGHMILVDEFLKLNATPAFKEMFMVVIQLGAILAVIALFWNRIFPFQFKKGEAVIRKDTMIMWFKIILATIPAGIVGVLFDDQINEMFYNYIVVAIALIVYGVLFILIENRNKGKKANTNTIGEMTYQTAFLIGIFQMLAAIFPGTSRSGATILGGILIGTSRTVATEFTFYLAIPAMFGASLLKLLKFGFSFERGEFIILIVGMFVAYVVSVIVIKFLLGYIRKHDFKVFGWYRIILGALVLLYFNFW